MPGRGQGKGKGRVGKGRDVGPGPAADNDGGLGRTDGWEHGKSGLSPGHLKREDGVRSARDYAPGHGGEAPGQVGRGGEKPVESPESDLIRREA